MPDDELVLMMRASTGLPALARSRQWATAWRLGPNVPRRWTRITSSHSSGSMLKSIRSRRMPALLTTASSRPNASRAARTSRRAPSQSDTSSVLGTAAPPMAWISSTTSAAGTWELPDPSRAPPRSFTTTRAPWRANSSAWARPMPRPAPVTMTTRPSQIPLIGLSSLFDARVEYKLRARAGGSGGRCGVGAARAAPDAPPTQTAQPRSRRRVRSVGFQIEQPAQRAKDLISDTVADRPQVLQEAQRGDAARVLHRRPARLPQPRPTWRHGHAARIVPLARCHRHYEHERGTCRVEIVTADHDAGPPVGDLLDADWRSELSPPDVRAHRSCTHRGRLRG